MNLTDYLDIYQLASGRIAAHEENRAFGLEHERLSNIEKLLEWKRKHIVSLRSDRLSSTIGRYLHHIDIFSGVAALVFGFATGAALLSYSGSEPVNVIYFLAIAVALPILTMMLALIALMRIDTPVNTLVHLSPAYWIERLLRLLGEKDEKYSSIAKLDPRITNYLVLKRSQILGLIFSIGVLLALLILVATGDIAFGWSTTLHILPESFHAFLDKLALPWRSLIPSAVPSSELVEQSQYFRLGGRISGDMIQNASQLGEWWKFLAMATLVYAVGLRLIVWLVVSLGFGRMLERSLLAEPHIAMLLWEMDTPVITGRSENKEEVFEGDAEPYGRAVSTLDDRYDASIGWSLTKESIAALNDALKVKASNGYAAGGANTIEADNDIISRSNGSVVLYVKAYEPPMMDFIDFLSKLSRVAAKITVAPIGTPAERYKADLKDIEIWGRKLAEVNETKVWMWRG